MAKKRCLFFSADKDYPQCSFYQLGVDFNQFLQNCKSIEVTYFESGSRSEPYPPYDVNQFDMVIFNYANGILMNYLSGSYFDSITVPKLIVNYENRADPWGSLYSPRPLRELFDYMIIPDIRTTEDESVVFIPRVVRRFEVEPRPINLDCPIISTLGLPAPQKDLVAGVLAINEEFDTATYRLHCPPDSRTLDYEMMREKYRDCLNAAKPGVKVELSQDFWPAEEAIRWLSESDLNLYFYTADRDVATEGTFPGSIDRAVSAQRPIAVQKWLCTRYAASYLGTYPEKSLRELMEAGVENVRKMYEDGDPDRVAAIFDKWIEGKF